MKKRPFEGRVMRWKLWLVGVVALILSVWASVANASTFYWRHAGRDPFLGHILSEEDLGAKFQGKQELFAQRLRIADPSLPAEGIAAGTAAALQGHRGVRPETLKDGAHVAWMIDGHGVKRNVVVVGDRPGYRVSILNEREGRIYDFHWASSCGNVTPLGTRPLSRPPAPRISSPVRPSRRVIVVRPVPVLVPVPLLMAVPPPYGMPVWVW